MREKIDKRVKYTPEVLGKTIDDLIAYTEATEIPIFAEFCYQFGHGRQYLYDLSKDNENLSDAIKNCVMKKEAQLEAKGLRNEINPTMAIFSLKQLGWRDKQDVELNAKVNSITDLVNASTNTTAD